MGIIDMKDIVIYGAGGFGREVACLIRRINETSPAWTLRGFIDDGIEAGESNEYGMVLGGIDYLNNIDSPLGVAIAIGNPAAVKKVAEKVKNTYVDFPNIIDPDVLFLDKETFHMGKGNIMSSKCLVSCNVVIGDFNLFNIGVGIGHDVRICDYNVLMPNVNISGGVQIGCNNLFGVKSTVLQYLKIGDDVKIGANSLLMRNARSHSLYFGSPASRMEF